MRHNIETMLGAGAEITRILAVGGGAQGSLWPQIVSDITGRDQVIPTQTIGASLGATFLAAQAIGEAAIDDWNPPRVTCRPDPQHAATYDELYRLYHQLYSETADVVHALSRMQHRADAASS